MGDLVSCPRCDSTQIIKQGKSIGKQHYKCKPCNRKFYKFTIEDYDASKKADKRLKFTNAKKISCFEDDLWRIEKERQKASA